MMVGALVVLGYAAQGCDLAALGCDASGPGDYVAPVTVNNPSQTASLVKAGCGENVDTFQLLVSDPEGNKMQIAFTGSPRINESATMTLWKDAAMPIDRATTANGVRFSLARAAKDSTFDATDLNNGTITITSAPRAPGDRMDVRVQLYFLDGRSMDQTFGATVVSTPCVAQ